MSVVWCSRNSVDPVIDSVDELVVNSACEVEVFDAGVGGLGPGEIPVLG